MEQGKEVHSLRETGARRAGGEAAGVDEPARTPAGVERKHRPGGVDRELFGEMLGHQLQLLLVGGLAAVETYVVAPLLYELPPPLSWLARALLFSFCFGWACKVLEDCCLRLTALVSKVLGDPNLIRFCQTVRRRRAARRSE